LHAALPILAHILADDGITVLDTFAVTVAADEKNYVLGHWEFIRRYMEKGPKESYFDRSKKGAAEKANQSTLLFCNDIDGKRESPEFSRYRMKLNFVHASTIYHLFSPFIKGLMLCRIFAMKTCKVPIWPQQVEDECIIDDNDPYIVTAKDNIELTLNY